MIRAIVLYDEAPDADRYQRHVELCRAVPGATFRHGRVFGAPVGEPKHAYYAEFEFPDLDAFKTATRGADFSATAQDAMEMGKPFSVMFADLA